MTAPHKITLHTPRITYFMSAVTHSAGIGHWLMTDCVYPIFRTKLETPANSRGRGSIRFEGDMHMSYVNQAYRVSFILNADAEYSDNSLARRQLERECQQTVTDTMQDYLRQLSGAGDSGAHQIPGQISLKKPEKPVEKRSPLAGISRIRLLKSA